MKGGHLAPNQGQSTTQDNTGYLRKPQTRRYDTYNRLKQAKTPASHAPKKCLIKRIQRRKLLFLKSFFQGIFLGAPFSLSCFSSRRVCVCISTYLLSFSSDIQVSITNLNTCLIQFHAKRCCKSIHKTLVMYKSNKI